MSETELRGHIDAIAKLLPPPSLEDVATMFACWIGLRARIHPDSSAIVAENTLYALNSLRWVYNKALDDARNACKIEEADCETEAEKDRCRNIATHLLHISFEDETAD